MDTVFINGKMVMNTMDSGVWALDKVKEFGKVQIVKTSMLEIGKIIELKVMALIPGLMVIYF